MAFATPGQNADLHRSRIFDVSHVTAVVTGGGSNTIIEEASPETKSEQNLEARKRVHKLINEIKTLVSNGAKVYVAELREEASKVVMNLYNTGPGEIIPITTDISKKHKVAELVDRITEAEPNGIQVLINNAGIARDYATEFAGNPPPDLTDPVAISEHFWNSDPESWQQNFTTNCMGGYFMAIGFLPLLAKGCGVIPGYTSSVVNVTSNSAFLKNTTRGHISYGASKAAFVHLSRMLAHLFSQTPVRVNMIAPGTFPTEMTTGSSGPDQKSTLTRAATNSVGRAGHEIDMAATVLFLAGRGGTFYTAQTLFPDGGETLIEAASV